MVTSRTAIRRTLEIVVAGVDDVWSLETTVTYDPAVVAWAGYSTEGSVLGSDGAVVAADVDLVNVGELAVGVSRVHEPTGIDIDASGGVLLELIFIPNTNAASSGLPRDGRRVPRTVGEPPEVIAGVDCSGGTTAIR